MNQQIEFEPHTQTSWRAVTSPASEQRPVVHAQMSTSTKTMMDSYLYAQRFLLAGLIILALVTVGTLLMLRFATLS